jgi:hypothetical protein
MAPSQRRGPVLLLLWFLLITAYAVHVVTFWRGHYVVGGDFGSKQAAIITLVLVVAIVLAAPVLLTRATLRWYRRRAA